MVLREWHRTRVEPAVDYFGGALHFAAALMAFAGEVVKVGAVQLYILICGKGALFL